METIGQLEKVFFKDSPPLAETVKSFLNRNNSSSPFHKFVGNGKVVKRLGRILYHALIKYNHACPYNFAFFGPASTGKTTLAKIIGEEILKVPFVEIQPQTIRNVSDVLAQIAAVCENYKVGSGTLKLVPMVKPGHFLLPPMVVFIDEVHLLKSEVMESLLKATERSDAMLVTENGWEADCRNVCWIIATTDRGDLFDAFDTRFQKFNLELYTKAEVSKIINSKFPEWESDVCDLVARYSTCIPREAIAFAEEMKLEKEQSIADWEEIAAEIAEDQGIDPYGMSYQRLKILTALGQQGPIPANRLAHVAGCKEDELRKFIMPALLANTADQEQLVSVATGRGYTITNAGLRELDKREINNLGLEAMPEAMKIKYKLLNRGMGENGHFFSGDN